MKLIHMNEPEHVKELALEKAKKILGVKPDVIFFEYPKTKKSTLSYFNKFAPDKKPKDEIEELKGIYKTASKKYPWLESEYKVIEAIKQLWNKGKQVYLFEIDAPVELASAGENSIGLSNFVWNYLRELYMGYNLYKIAKRFENNKVALVFCHNFHWENITFLLRVHSKHKIWDYYTKKYGITKSRGEIQSELKSKDKILYKYWRLLEND